MLSSFSYMSILDTALCCDIWQNIDKLKYYFYKFSGANAPESMQLALMHALGHYSKDGNLLAYVKKLARNMGKSDSKYIPVDFMEQTQEGEAGIDINTEELLQSDRTYSGKSRFEDEVVERLSEVTDYSDIEKMALEFIDKFVLLCKALRTLDTTTKYYSQVFIDTCLKLKSKYENFNELCLQLYDEYQDEIDWFLALNDEPSDWKEADFSLLFLRKSKRIKLLSDETEEEVSDADIEDCFIKGNINNKRVYKVYYEDIWEKMCDMVDSLTTNEMKLVINDNFITRTLGGSYSTLNPNLFNIYELIRHEIATNIINNTDSRLLNIGSKSVYILVNSDSDVSIPDMVVKGIPISFTCEDVTDELMI